MKTLPTPTQVASYVMWWMAENDEYKLSHSKAHVLTAYAVAGIYQATGDDIGVVRAGQQHPIVSGSWAHIDPDGDGEQLYYSECQTCRNTFAAKIEEHFENQEQYLFENQSHLGVVEDVLLIYGCQSPEQVVALSRWSDEWKEKKSQALVMDKAKIPVFSPIPKEGEGKQ